MKALWRAELLSCSFIDVRTGICLWPPLLSFLFLEHNKNKNKNKNNSSSQHWQQEYIFDPEIV